jgi:hypothetical protein
MNKVTKTFYDANRKVYVTYELLTRSLGVEVVNSLMEAFADLTGHYNCRSRDQAWRSFKKFVSYLALIGFTASTRDIDVVSGFADYLNTNGRLKKTNGTHYNFVRRLVSFISESTQNDLWANQGLVYKSFTRETACVRDNIVTIDDLKKISDSCKRCISEIRAKFALRNYVMQGSSELEKVSGGTDLGALKELIVQETLGNWTQRQLVEAGHSKLGHVGLRRLITYKELTIESVLPIYLIIMIQTAANPLSLLEIGLHCISANPLDENSVTLEWSKNRASTAQKIGLLKGGKYSVPNLVQLVTDMTVPIRHLASPADGSLLFITRTGVKAKRISVQSMHNYLGKFREAHDLPYFTFADIRRVVAEFVYSKTSSLGEVAKLLQHRDESTTKLYLRSPAIAQSSYERLAKFQGQMLSFDSIESDYETVLGFQCAAPKSGFAGGSRKGEPCLEFLSCATCKNAIVAIDDPVAVARIIRAKEHLEGMEKSHFWIKRIELGLIRYIDLC